MRYALVYGSIAGAVVIAAITAGMTLNLPNHFRSDWFGYLVMLTALSLIFVGIKRYRDIECGGVISFSRAFALGLGISTIAAVIYVIGWEVYLAASERDFMEGYTASVIDDMRAEGATDAAIEAKADQLRAMADLYREPLFRLAMTFVEIFPVGLAVTLISALLLRNSQFLPVARS